MIAAIQTQATEADYDLRRAQEHEEKHPGTKIAPKVIRDSWAKVMKNLQEAEGELQSLLAELDGLPENAYGIETVGPPSAKPLFRYLPRRSRDWTYLEFARTRCYFDTDAEKAAFALLWEAELSGSPFVKKSDLEMATKSKEIEELFKESGAWKKVVIPASEIGGPSNHYCLVWSEPQSAI
jgi:hypothetical protein